MMKPYKAPKTCMVDLTKINFLIWLPDTEVVRMYEVCTIHVRYKIQVYVHNIVTRYEVKSTVYDKS